MARKSIDFSKTVVGSDCYFDFFCIPCQEDGRHVEAHGYCRDCEDYLCSECYKSHRRPRPWRHHVLLDEHEMPKDTPPTLKDFNVDRCTEICPKHLDKVIEYYCHEHDALACSTCAFDDHRSCETVDTITEVADQERTREEYSKTQRRSEDLEHKAYQIQQAANANIGINKDCLNEVLNAIAEYKQVVHDWIETCANDLVIETKTHHSEIEKKLKTIPSKCNSVNTELKRALENLSLLQTNEQYCNLFVSLKKVQRIISASESELEDAEKESLLNVLDFEPNPQLQDIIREPGGFADLMTYQVDSDDTDKEDDSEKDEGDEEEFKQGNVDNDSGNDDNDEEELEEEEEDIEQEEGKSEEKGEALSLENKSDLDTSDHKSIVTDDKINRADRETERADATSSYAKVSRSENIKPPEANSKSFNVRHVMDVTVRVKRDTHTCSITGIAILSDGNFFVDASNKSVKVIDPSSQKMVHGLKLESAPWDVTLLGNDKVAVTLPVSKTVKLLSIPTDGKINTDGTLTVKNECYGIAFAKDTFWVSYKNPGTVEALALDGKLKLSLGTDASGKHIFQEPEYIAACQHSDSLFVSDGRMKTITRLSLKGDVLSIYGCRNLGCPAGLDVASDGTAYACDYLSGTVYIALPPYKTVKELLDFNQTFGLPWVVSYNESTHQLFICRQHHDDVQIFQLS